MGQALRKRPRAESPLETLNEDLWFAIFQRISGAKGSLAHALVSRAWLRLAIQAQSHVLVQPRGPVHNANIFSLLGSLPGLTSLSLPHSCLTDGFLLHLATACPRLQEFSVEEGTEAGRPGCFRRRHLESLTAAGLQKFAERVPRLRVLELNVDLSPITGDSQLDFHLCGALCQLQLLERLVLKQRLESVSEEASRLTTLKQLVVDACDPGPFNDLLKRIPSLRTVTLLSCPGDLQVSSTLVQMTTLRKMNVTCSGEVLFPLTPLRFLRALRLSCQSLSELPDMPALQKLELAFHSQGDSPSLRLGTLEALRYLYISSDVTGFSFRGKSCPLLLEEVHLNCPYLESLPQQCLSVGPPCPPALKRMTLRTRRLKKLHGSFCWRPSLQKVVLDVPGVQDWPHDMFEGFTSLASLSMRSDFLKSLPPSIGCSRGLKLLELDAVSLATLPESMRYLENLEVLRMKYCKVEQMGHFLGDLRSLRELNLDSMVFLNSLGDGVANLKCLEVMILRRCPALSNLPDGLWETRPLTVSI